MHCRPVWCILCTRGKYDGKFYSRNHCFVLSYICTFQIALKFCGHEKVNKSKYIRRYFEIVEPEHNKTNKMIGAPSEDADQTAHLPSLIRVAVRMKKLWRDLSLNWMHK